MDGLKRVGKTLPLPEPRSELIKALQRDPGTWYEAPSQSTAYANQTYRRHGIEQAVRGGKRYLRYSPGLERFFSESQSTPTHEDEHGTEFRSDGAIR